MQEKPTESCRFEDPEPEKKDGDWADDQKRRSYYYDDAHGYQEYKGEAEEGDDRVES